jgi:GDP-4-dehydro-6-deoxy-D-mannose reductase
MADSVLITGASGLAGSHLVEHLAGSCGLVAWTRSPPPPGLVPLAHWRQLDMLDRDRVRSAVREIQPREVYHCAGVSQVDGSWTSPAEPLVGNVLATHHLLDALRRAGAACRLLVPGSASIYARSPSPLREDSPLAPDGPYALSKLAQEMLALRAVAEDGIDVIVTRSFNHTGPRQAPAFMASSIARQIARAEHGEIEPVLRVGNLDARRDLTDVRDVVRAYAALMADGTPGEVYNVASGVGRTVRFVLDTLVGLANVRMRVETDPARLRPSDNPVLIGDASKLRTLSGWEPRIPFDTMLEDLLAYWRGDGG